MPKIQGITMAYSPLNLLPFSLFASDGSFLSGGKLYFYESGTATPATAYSDSAGTSAGTSVTMDARGEPTTIKQIWLDDEVNYRLTLKDSANNTLWGPIDNIRGYSFGQTKTVDTIAALKALSINVYTFAITLGHTTAGDGGNGVFWYDSGSAVADNNGSVIQPTAGGGRWILFHNGTLSVKQFGATGDGVTDDTTALQNCANAVDVSGGNVGCMFAPAGTYLISTTIDLTVNTSGGNCPGLIGESAQSTKFKAAAGLGANPMFVLNAASPSRQTKIGHFELEGTGYTNNEVGIRHINGCHFLYEQIYFDQLLLGIRFENLSGGFCEQNSLFMCRQEATTKFMVEYFRAASSTQNSFRATGLVGQNFADLGTISGASVVNVDNTNADPNVYNAPFFVTLWTDAGGSTVVWAHTGATPARLYGHITYETSAAWTLGSGGSATNTFRGVMEGVSTVVTRGNFRLLPSFPSETHPAFSAHATSSQNITTGVATKVTFGGEDFDTNANFASDAFTPTIAGYYQFDAQLRCAGTTITAAYISFYKNGSEYSRGEEINTSSGNNLTLTAGLTVYLNGSTDYIELYGLITATSPQFNFVNSAATTRLSGCLVREDTI